MMVAVAPENATYQRALWVKNVKMVAVYHAHLWKMKTALMRKIVIRKDLTATMVAAVIEFVMNQSVQAMKNVITVSAFACRNQMKVLAVVKQ